jgi:hypothetical protein
MPAAPGQAPATARFKPAYAGDCAATVVLAGQRAGDVVQAINHRDLPVPSVTDDAQKELTCPPAARSSAARRCALP